LGRESPGSLERAPRAGPGRAGHRAQRSGRVHRHAADLRHRHRRWTRRL